MIINTKDNEIIKDNDNDRSNKEVTSILSYRDYSIYRGHIVSYSKISDLKFINENIKSYMFNNIYTNNITFENVTFTDCVFEYNTWSNNIVFKNCDFFGCTFYNVYMRNATFDHVTFINMVFEYSGLSGDFNDVSFSFKYTPDRFLHHGVFENVTGLPEMVCPREGSFVGYKKVSDSGNDYIVKLEIPEDAERSSAFSNKCRCSKAKVLKIYNRSNEEINKVTNRDNVDTDYIVGDIVYPDEWDDNRWNECSHGIHFFMTEQEAIEY